MIYNTQRDEMKGCELTIEPLNFHPPKVVSRYRDPQLQVAENYSYLINLGPDICKFRCLNARFAPNESNLNGK